MPSLQDEQVREFLGAGTRTAMLGFTASDGRPLVAPVWFLVDGSELVFNTGADTAKGRSIARDPRVTLCVDDARWPYAFVQVQGRVRTSEDPAELLRTATEIARRYVGDERAEEFGRRNGVPGELVVRLTPSKINAVFDMVA
ncbi:PPOX class F420-dependent oxidoreductase [Salinifilum ghardaiensis]